MGALINGPLPRLLLARAGQAVLVAVMVGVLTFVLVRALPGDMAYRIAAGRYGFDWVSTAAAEAVRQDLGLDQPAPLALLAWLWDLLRLDLGQSLVTGQTVAEEVGHQFGHSLLLAASAAGLSLLIGPPLGALAGLRPGGVLDRGLLLVAVLMRSVPPFTVGVVLILLLSVQARLLPAAGSGSLAHTILPMLTLALCLAAVSARVSRDAVAGVTASAFYTFGRTKGLGGGLVFWRHGLRNAGVPVLTYFGVQFVGLVEGMVVIETLFAWPGIGHALVHAVVARDVPMIQGAALAMGLFVVAMNTVIDVVCALLDPRGGPS
ncbi:ABC transporter permease [Novispirillum itersonii]|uniref:Peptide/nickel transport system permease protein n=1 Tax=Novispirillum itersonii TaxID=189 RepID=A0A7X0DM76_NOVIT|nr:ABC transporter permease [Novispirillum itersonii]MBB6208892.1 peptide/nickel transport system permease protein [Novispirillum itersonii]